MNKMRGKRLNLCGHAKMSACQNKTKGSRSILRQLIVELNVFIIDFD